MQLRHEYKHIISPADAAVLQSRLPALMQRDPHAASDGRYHIRSLYFDTMSDTVLREKLDGLSRREKFRIRIYNGQSDFIRLEKKIKIGDLGTKVSAVLSRQEVTSILQGDIGFLLTRPEAVLQEFYVKLQYSGLQPRTLVDYTRIPFVYQPGNVRVTIDRDIRTGVYANDLFDAHHPTLPAADTAIVLEVKYDAFLPDCIRQLVQLGDTHTSAFSKYAACRRYDATEV